MHKKLEAELVSLAHQILQMKNKDDIVKLKNMAKELHEKLSVLTFVNNYFLTTPNASEDKREILAAIEDLNNLENKVSNEELISEIVEETVSEENDIKETVIEEVVVEEEEVTVETVPVVEAPIVEEQSTEEQPIEEQFVKSELDVPTKVTNELETNTTETIKTEADQIVTKIIEQEVTDYKTATGETVVQDTIEEVQATTSNPNSLANNEEFKNSIPADVAANLFEKASNLVQNKSENAVPPQDVNKPVETVNQPNIAKKVETATVPTPTKAKASLNDRLYNQKLQIGLNDRIAFVKHLFNYSQEDFNRVLSQLNTFETEAESKDFINTQVKPEYNWSGKEEYEERLIDLIERKFM